MPKISVTLPPEILKAVKNEAKQKDMPVSAFVRMIIAQRLWRKRRKKDKQHWLEAIYAGKAKRKIRKFEDIFSDRPSRRRR